MLLCCVCVFSFYFFLLFTLLTGKFSVWVTSSSTLQSSSFFSIEWCLRITSFENKLLREMFSFQNNQVDLIACMSAFF